MHHQADHPDRDISYSLPPGKHLRDRGKSHLRLINPLMAIFNGYRLYVRFPEGMSTNWMGRDESFRLLLSISLSTFSREKIVIFWHIWLIGYEYMVRNSSINGYGGNMISMGFRIWRSPESLASILKSSTTMTLETSRYI